MTSTIRVALQPVTRCSGSAEVRAELWVGALLVAAGELADPFPAAIEELAREYFGRWPPEAKA